MSCASSHHGYFVSWSGGKDGCLAMHRLVRQRGVPQCLLTMLDESGQRSRGHHLRPEVLGVQAEAIGVPMIVRATTWGDYEDQFKAALVEIKADGLTEGVFGDIDLAEHREWVERVCNETGVIAHEPLWLEERESLLREFMDAGYVAVVVGIREDVLDSSVLGRFLDDRLIREFQTAGIDASGELGEYHTVVVDGPLFRFRVELAHERTISRDGYRFLDVVPTRYGTL